MEKNEKHLTARQIINRFKKGAYTNECAETVSSVISSSKLEFDSVAIPVQHVWLENVIENIDLCFKINEHREAEEKILSSVADEQARIILAELALPDVWNAVCGVADSNMVGAIYAHGLMSKHTLRHSGDILFYLCYQYKAELKRLGIDQTRLNGTLYLMFKDEE